MHVQQIECLSVLSMIGYRYNNLPYVLGVFESEYIMLVHMVQCRIQK